MRHSLGFVHASVDVAYHNIITECLLQTCAGLVTVSMWQLIITLLCTMVWLQVNNHVGKPRNYTKVLVTCDNISNSSLRESKTEHTTSVNQQINEWFEFLRQRCKSQQLASVKDPKWFHHLTLQMYNQSQETQCNLWYRHHSLMDIHSVD